MAATHSTRFKTHWAPCEDGSDTYVAGEWITDKWFVAYRYHPKVEELDNVNELRSEYQLSNSWLLEGSAGDRGKHGVDILWMRRWED